MRGWVQSSSKLLREIVVKVYNLCRVKTNRLAVLTVKSGLDPHMIIKLEDDLNRCFIHDVNDGYFICLFMG